MSTQPPRATLDGYARAWESPWGIPAGGQANALIVIHRHRTPQFLVDDKKPFVVHMEMLGDYPKLIDGTIDMTWKEALWVAALDVKVMRHYDTPPDYNDVEPTIADCDTTFPPPSPVESPSPKGMKHFRIEEGGQVWSGYLQIRQPVPATVPQ